MTAQEVFDKVVEHLARQKIPATNGGDGCMLRTGGGLMCAVGCLIPEEDYRPEMEDHSAVQVVDARDNIFSIWLKHNYGDHINLLDKLQSIHDHAVRSEYGISEWPIRLATSAFSENLNFDAEDFKIKLADPDYCYNRILI